MRTTLNIDDEVLRAAREMARQQNLPTGVVVSRLLRRAMTGPTSSAGAGEVAGYRVAGFRPFTGRDTPVDDAVIDRLRDDEGV